MYLNINDIEIVFLKRNASNIEDTSTSSILKVCSVKDSGTQKDKYNTKYDGDTHSTALLKETPHTTSTNGLCGGKNLGDVCCKLQCFERICARNPKWNMVLCTITLSVQLHCKSHITTYHPYDNRKQKEIHERENASIVCMFRKLSNAVRSASTLLVSHLSLDSGLLSIYGWVRC